jgi:predicted TPR repeat methyltransferase
VPESYKNLVELVEAHPLFAERVVEPYLNQTQPVIDSSIVSRVVTSPLRDLSPLEAVYKRLYRIISNYSRDISKYLDFGSNMGAFAEFVRIALPGRDISCCEINPYYVKKCKERYHQLRIIDKPLTSDVNQEKFDFIYCSDVIEHIWDLDELFRVLNSCLRDMGKLMLVTPDLNNKNAQKQGFWWWSFIVPHHSQFFNLSSMTALLTRFDLQIIEHGQIEEELFVVCQKKTAA